MDLKIKLFLPPGQRLGTDLMIFKVPLLCHLNTDCTKEYIVTFMINLYFFYCKDVTFGIF